MDYIMQIALTTKYLHVVPDQFFSNCHYGQIFGKLLFGTTICQNVAWKDIFCKLSFWIIFCTLSLMSSTLADHKPLVLKNRLSIVEKSFLTQKNISNFTQTALLCFFQWKNCLHSISECYE